MQIYNPKLLNMFKKKKENCDPFSKEKTTMVTNPQTILMLELAEKKNFKGTIITTLNEEKENMLTVKKIAISHQRNKNYLKKQTRKNKMDVLKILLKT